MPKCRELASGGIRKRLIDVSNLPWGSRCLVIFAYISLALLLAATLFFELFADWLSYVDYQAQDGTLLRIPLPVIVVSCLFFCYRLGLANLRGERLPSRRIPARCGDIHPPVAAVIRRPERFGFRIVGISAGVDSDASRSAFLYRP